MKIIIHTAEITPARDGRIYFASAKKQDVTNAVWKWRREYPGKRVRYETIIDDYWGGDKLSGGMAHGRKEIAEYFQMSWRNVCRWRAKDPGFSSLIKTHPITKRPVVIIAEVPLWITEFNRKIRKNKNNLHLSSPDVSNLSSHTVPKNGV